MKFSWKKYLILVAILGIGLFSYISYNFISRQFMDSTQRVLVLAAEGGTVTSSDGLLTLNIHAGALSVDTEISISLASAQEAPDKLLDLAESDESTLSNASAYRLEPDGLEFILPITFQLQAPDALDDNTLESIDLLTQSANDDPQWVDDLEIAVNLEDATVVISGQLTHFSWMVRTKGYVKLSVTRAGYFQEVDLPFYVDTRVENLGFINLGVNVRPKVIFTGPILYPVDLAVRTPTPYHLSPRKTKEFRLEFVCQITGRGIVGYKVRLGTWVSTYRKGVRRIKQARAIPISLSSDVLCIQDSTPTPTSTSTSTPDPNVPTDTPLPTLTPLDPVNAAIMTALAEQMDEMDILNRGRHPIDANDLEGALFFFDNVLEDDPQNKEAYYNIGVIRIDLGEYTLALEAFRQAIAIDPTYDLALFGRAFIGVQVGDNLEKQLSSWIGFLEHHPQADEMRAFANLQVANLLVAIDVESQITPPPPTEQAPTQAPPEEPTQEPISEE